MKNTERLSEDALRWRRPNAVPALAQGAIHVWRVALEADRQTVACVARWLDPDERGRAERLRTEKLQRRFIVRRARLRQILALYVADQPGTLRFERGQYGKPRLAEPWSMRQIEFSSSHSADWALVAIGTGRPLGVDVEQMRPFPRLQDLSRNYFAPLEYQSLARLAEAERLEAFFRIWVCKEAVLKALGTGLSLGLDQVVVSADAAWPTIVALGHDTARAAAWRLKFVPPAPGFSAALAWPTIGREASVGEASVELYDFPPGTPSL